MIYGIGVDILKDGRIDETHARYGDRLERRMLHPLEAAAFAQAKHPGNFLAKSFAAKEAFVKALGTGFRGVAHHEVGVVRDTLGKPGLVYSDRLQALLAERGIRCAHLSLSDDAGLVCAMVVLET
jgi:holo-[acyl-carrier protein] synthase